jgi:hypothetical protein
MPRVSATRKVTEAQKKYVAGEQSYKCNNKPGYNLIGLNDYECPLWNLPGNNRGSFDKSGYEIDHIKEWSVTQNDGLENLQALCLMCHRVKTKNFIMKTKSQPVINENKPKGSFITKSNPEVQITPIKKVVRKKKESNLINTIEEKTPPIKKVKDIIPVYVESVEVEKPQNKRKPRKKASDIDAALNLLTNLNPSIGEEGNSSSTGKGEFPPVKKPIRKSKIVSSSEKKVTVKKVVTMKKSDNCNSSDINEKKMIAAEKKLLAVEKKLLIAEKKLLAVEKKESINKTEESLKNIESECSLYSDFTVINVYPIPSYEDKHERHTKIYNSMWILKFDENNFELETINDEEKKLLESTKKLFTALKNIIKELIICDKDYKNLARYLWVFDESLYNFKIILTCIKFHWYYCDNRLAFTFIIFLFSNFCSQMKLQFPNNNLIITNTNLIETSTKDIRIHRDNLVNILENDISEEDSKLFWTQILTDIINTQRDFIERFIFIIKDLNAYFIGMIKYLKLNLPALRTVLLNYNKVIDMIKDKNKHFINIIRVNINNDVCWWTTPINEEGSPLCSIGPSVHKIQQFLSIIDWCVSKTF